MGLDIDICKINKQKRNIMDGNEFRKLKHENIIYWRKNYLVLDFIQRKLNKAKDFYYPEKLTKIDIEKLIQYCNEVMLDENYDEYEKKDAKSALDQLTKIDNFDYKNNDLFISWVW